MARHFGTFDHARHRPEQTAHSARDGSERIAKNATVHRRKARFECTDDAGQEKRHRLRPDR
ncbi:hypothetical protein B6V73_00315 [Thioclava sp. JM3]|nr:hypothetical protein B6V73_00315 [Thioclava sp. JM3]